MDRGARGPQRTGHGPGTGRQGRRGRPRAGDDLKSWISGRACVPRVIGGRDAHETPGRRGATAWRPSGPRVRAGRVRAGETPIGPAPLPAHRGPPEGAGAGPALQRALAPLRLDAQLDVQTLPVEHAEAVADPVVPAGRRGRHAHPRRPHEAAPDRPPRSRPRHRGGCPRRRGRAPSPPSSRDPTAPRRRSSPHRPTTVPPAPQSPAASGASGCS